MIQLKRLYLATTSLVRANVLAGKCSNKQPEFISLAQPQRNKSTPGENRNYEKFLQVTVPGSYVTHVQHTARDSKVKRFFFLLGEKAINIFKGYFFRK